MRVKNNKREMDDREQNRPTTNRRRNENADPNGANTMICNCTSYCYFTLAIVLFTVGSVITILALDDSDNMFSSLGHMWLVGPIFISSGLMVAVKTIIYLRRETMLTFLARQRSFLRMPLNQLTHIMQDVKEIQNFNYVVVDSMKVTRQEKTFWYLKGTSKK
ncbi:uncharacterized protein LOC111084430 isoform X2 [Limulus polyphemus]|uniref:Uncharacterized protein LOC111084430 isoform X2 n=1 Tax=Limulus polyphemus TaxID=6850 RepID=A0ABM1RZN6_LIMPO|nr:uncharacterized protein LOC111084430 isoform X2 [Limulus polyphemus]